MMFTIDDKTLTYSLDVLNQDEFTVSSSPTPYTVSFHDAENPCDAINALLATNPKNILLIDEKVFALYGKDINHPNERIFKAPALERFKTMQGVMDLVALLYQQEFTKKETLVVVGGGIIQDIGALVGALYKRGIKWVHFPTTVLAMADSCIGGKAGVNYEQAKNQLALFSSPHAVVINPHFINTLEERDVKSGLGEILKLCITGGPELVKLFADEIQHTKALTPVHLKKLISVALMVKKAVIEDDEFELNIRKALNYGHTIGHAIEAMSDYEIPHGIAVIVGMMLVNQLAVVEGYLSSKENAEMNRLCLLLLDDKTKRLLLNINTNDLLDYLKQDKKVAGDSITFVLLKKPGHLLFHKLTMNALLQQTIATTIQGLFHESHILVL